MKLFEDRNHVTEKKELLLVATTESANYAFCAVAFRALNFYYDGGRGRTRKSSQVENAYEIFLSFFLP